MLSEIKLNTRGEGGRDFVWFTPEGIDEDWRRKYKVFYAAANSVNLCAEIENGNYRIYFDKIPRPWTITRGGSLTPPYVDLIASGKCGSESAKAFFKILTNFFCGNKEEVVKLFAEEITYEYIESVFDKAKTLAVETEISEKIETIVSKLPDIEISTEVILKDNIFAIDNFEKNKKAFFSELKKICEPSESYGYISLVVTENSLAEDVFEEFKQYTAFSSGLCLTTGTIDGGKAIEKTSKEVKVENPKPEQPVVIESPEPEPTDPEPDPFPPVGTTTVKDALKRVLSSFVSKIRSDRTFRLLLIITSATILALLFMVRSCAKRSGNGSEKNSPEQKEQQSFPQSPDSSKKSSTDTLTIKADSLKNEESATRKVQSNCELNLLHFRCGILSSLP